MLKNKKDHVMKLIINIILCSFVSSCYLSYEIREKEDSNVLEEDSGVLKEDSGVLEEDSGVLVDELPLESIDNWPLDPILMRTEPEIGCTNKDSWIVVSGSEIHPHAILYIKYFFSDETYIIDIQYDTDDYNQRLAKWINIEEIKFRTYQKFTFLPGRYLIKVINPNKSESNEIGLNLQFCDNGIVK